MIAILSLWLMILQGSHPDPEPLVCKGPVHEKVRATLFVNGRQQKQPVYRKSEPGNLFFVLNDTSYRLVGFRGFAPCPDNGVTYDFIEKKFYGRRISRNDPFVRRLKPGDIIEFDCITIRKGDRYYTIAAMAFEVIE